MEGGGNGVERDVAEAALRGAVEALEAMLAAGVAAVVEAARVVGDAIERGGTVLVFGNGGSAAEAQHFAAELVGRFERERRGLPAVALTTDTSALTAIGNDYGFARVFARQIEAVGRPGDVALGISTSGASPNVVEGLRAARARGLATIGLTGRDGGEVGRVADVHVNVPLRSTARVQEVQLVLLHALADLVERRAAGLAGAEGRREAP
jgi:D-sedoheptulose 7-phosphate isomerase